MTLPTIVPVGFDGTAKDFTKVAYDADGCARLINGTVSVPNGTAQGTYIGLVPFVKGAKFHVSSASFHLANFGAGATTVDIGVIYHDNVTNTNDEDAFVSASTAAQAGGFATIDEKEGLYFVATGNGWLAAKIEAADADATADISFNVLVAYG